MRRRNTALHRNTFGQVRTGEVSTSFQSTGPDGQLSVRKPLLSSTEGLLSERPHGSILPGSRHAVTARQHSAPDYKFVETTKFTERVVKFGLEEDLRKLQVELLRNPEKGATDPDTGGVRKVRMSDVGRNQGKRFGARVHYIVAYRRHVIYLVFVYSKGEQAKLSREQKRRLRAVVDQLFYEEE